MFTKANKNEYVIVNIHLQYRYRLRRKEKNFQLCRKMLFILFFQTYRGVSLNNIVGPYFFCPFSPLQLVKPLLTHSAVPPPVLPSLFMIWADRRAFSAIGRRCRTHCEAVAEDNHHHQKKRNNKKNKMMNEQPRRNVKGSGARRDGKSRWSSLRSRGAFAQLPTDSCSSHRDWFTTSFVVVVLYYSQYVRTFLIAPEFAMAPWRPEQTREEKAASASFTLFRYPEETTRLNGWQIHWGWWCCSLASFVCEELGKVNMARLRELCVQLALHVCSHK